jgi:hypothetical protein
MKSAQMVRLVVLSFVVVTLSAISVGVASGNVRHHRHRMMHMPMPMAGNGTTDTSNLVLVGGTPILRVYEGAGGFTAEERATEIQERVNNLLGQGPITAKDVTVAMQGDDAVVLVKGQLLFTASWQDADMAMANSTPMDLANIWAARMRTILPSLTSPTG